MFIRVYKSFARSVSRPDHRFLGGVGVSLGTSDDSPSFWEANLSSIVAKIKNTAILNEVLPAISASKLNAGQRRGSYLWLARNRTKLADNSCIVV